MTDTIQIEKLADRIATIFHGEKYNADLSINNYLKKELKPLSLKERVDVMDKLINWFDPSVPLSVCEDEKHAVIAVDDHVLARVVKLLLGRDITQADSNPEELLESLAASITIVFESLNKLISAINTTLMGKQDPDETIRQVIGYHLEGSSQTKTLESYIGQIGNAFFASHEASQKAAYTKVMQILEELSPEKIEKESGASRLSPMRKSKYYEVYELKFKKFEKWFESGRFMESFLREFEKNCQKISFN